MKFGDNGHAGQRMKPGSFGDPVTLTLAPPAGPVGHLDCKKQLLRQIYLMRCYCCKKHNIQRHSFLVLRSWGMFFFSERKMEVAGECSISPPLPISGCIFNAFTHLLLHLDLDFVAAVAVLLCVHVCSAGFHFTQIQSHQPAHMFVVVKVNMRHKVSAKHICIDEEKLSLWGLSCVKAKERYNETHSLKGHVSSVSKLL